MLIHSFYSLHKRVLKLGTVKNLYGDFSDKQKLSSLKKSAKCIILPDSKFKMTWNIVVIVLLLYTAVFIPFKIAFIEDDSVEMKVFEYFIDSLFAFDILVNFISATESSSERTTLIFDHKRLAINYLKSWFILDLLACFPFQLLGNLSFPGMADTTSNSELLRLARLPRLYKLIRLLRMFKMLRLLSHNKTISGFAELLAFHPASMRLAKLLVIYFLFPLHIMSCLWFYVASFNQDPGNWAEGIGLFETPWHH